MTSGLSFVKPFKYFSLSGGLFLSIGPFTRSEKEKYSLDFMGFGGIVSFSRDLDFVHFMRNFSLSLDFLMTQMYASSPDTRSSQIALDLDLLEEGESFNHKIEMRRPFLGLSFSYSFPESFSRMIKDKKESSSYGHRFSLSYLFSLKGFVKKSYQTVVAIEEAGLYKKAEDHFEKETVKGDQIIFAYHLSFL